MRSIDQIHRFFTSATAQANLEMPLYKHLIFSKKHRKRSSYSILYAIELKPPSVFAIYIKEHTSANLFFFIISPASECLRK